MIEHRFYQALPLFPFHHVLSIICTANSRGFVAHILNLQVHGVYGRKWRRRRELHSTGAFASSQGSGRVWTLPRGNLHAHWKSIFFTGKTYNIQINYLMMIFFYLPQINQKVPKWQKYLVIISLNFVQKDRNKKK